MKRIIASFLVLIVLFVAGIGVTAVTPTPAKAVALLAEYCTIHDNWLCDMYWHGVSEQWW